jgi:hypothetical protein
LLVLLLGAASCRENRGTDPDDGDVVIDKDRTQLFVGSIDGGVGTKWLRASADRFEESQKDVSYEDGKLGVQVVIRADKNAYTGNNLFSTIGSALQEVFFVEGAGNYYDYATTGRLMDITDIVEQPLTAFGETGSIADKMSQKQRDFYKVTASGTAKYYGLPHYECYPGIVYDVDLFEDMGFYFAAAGGFTGGTTGRAAGPDGIQGTYDDGLPATYDEYFQLCTRMVNNGVTPMVWTGQYSNQYIRHLLTALWADYEGLDRASLSFDFDGLATDIVTGFSGTTPVTASRQITNETGFELTQQAGKYWALNFVERLIKGNGYVSPMSYNQTYSHLNAQEDYIFSAFDPKIQPIGMMLEGSWWENESDDALAFERCIDSYGPRAAMENRRFASMPLPKAPGAAAGRTMYDITNSAGFIRAGVVGYKVGLAKSFLQFLYTDTSLAEFTAKTGILRGLDYAIPANLATTNYRASILAGRDTFQVVRNISSNPFFLNHATDMIASSRWDSVVSGTPYVQPISPFRNGTATAAQYFQGMAMTQAAWNNKYF